MTSSAVAEISMDPSVCSAIGPPPALVRDLGRVASGLVGAAAAPVKAVLFDFGHTLVDFQRTQEALHAAYQEIRDRIEAVAFMEVPELLDLVERVAGGVDRLVAESYEQRRMEEVDQAELFRQALSGIGFD